MKRSVKPILCAVCAVCAALLAGCAATGPAASSEAGKKADIGWVLGYTITLELAETPTTGYLWTKPAYDPTVLELQSDTYTPPEKSLCGAPGRRVFVFRSIGTGKSTVRTVYARPWEKTAPPAEVFERTFLIVEESGEPHEAAFPLLRIAGDVKLTQ